MTPDVWIAAIVTGGFVLVVLIICLAVTYFYRGH